MKAAFPYRTAVQDGGFASLRGALERTRRGSTALMAVTGPPGSGRSAFLDAAAELAAQEGLVVRRAQASRLEQGVGAGLVEQLLRSAADVAALRPAGRTDAAAPMTFLVDDVQWADEVSLAWLARLLADPESVPVLLVVAVCEGEADTELPAVQDLLTRADHLVRMAPLDVADVRALLAERGIVLSEESARSWTEATAGNPAWLASLSGRLEAGERLTRAGLLATARSRPVPWPLKARVAAALSGHPEPVRRLAHCAAVLDGSADGRTLARLAHLQPDEAADAARALLRLGWAADRRAPPVLWDCVREIAEDSLPLADWTELHRRAATLLGAAGAPAERIVPHLLETGPGEWPEAAWLLRRAADDARRRGDVELATRCLRRALREFSPDSPQRGEFLLALADVEQDLDTSATLRHVAQAVPLLDPGHARAAAVSRVPLTLFVAAPRAVAEALSSARTPDAEPPHDAEVAESRLRLEARVRLSGLASPNAAGDAVRRLRELAPGPGPGTPAQRELVSVLVFAGTLGRELPAAEAATLVRWMLDHEPASTASGYAASALMIASGIAAEAEAPVRSWLDAAVDAATRRGDERQRTRLLGWRALAALSSGRLADAWMDALEACAAGPGTLGDSDWLAVWGLVSVAVATGDAGWAGRLHGLLDESPVSGLPVRSFAGKVLGHLLNPHPEPSEAAAELVETARRAEAAGWCSQVLSPVDLWCVPLLLCGGDRKPALGLLAHACDRARAFGSPNELGRVLRVWGTVVHGRYALSLFAESVAVLREGTDVLELGRALRGYGTRLRAAGRPGSAELLAEADRIADEAGAPLLRCWTASLGAELRGVVPPGGGGLSDTERWVAALVALGHTNQDTARSLGVTRRAVEKTLTRLYRRLDVAGRAELAPVVRRMAGEAAFRSGVLSLNF
ncbi:AAA family ATPase [Streptomyces albus]|uniref:LuxR C-terminal-related transcriptional regulator n=1 Tax=Streptomyces albus TaxID=1888 RepID=UPI0033C11A82